MATLSKEEYLKRYLSGGDVDETKKKRKKRHKISSQARSNVRIVDDDVDFAKIATGNLENTLEEDVGDNDPTVADVIDERPEAVKQLEQYRTDKRWRKLNDDQSQKRRLRTDSDSDQSPPRHQQHDSDSDQSPPRRTRHDSDSDQSPSRRTRHDSDSDQSPPRERKHDSDSDQSPVRKRRHDSDSDQSPPRRTKQQVHERALKEKQSKGIEKLSRKQDKHETKKFQSRPQRHVSGQSPTRKTRHDSDSDQSPLRRTRNGSDSDQSPPRRTRHDSDSDQSPPRRTRHDSDSDQSPPRRKKNTGSKDSPHSRGSSIASARHDKDEKGRAKKTLSGATAGLQSSKDMKAEAKKLKQRENEAFNQMDAEVLGKGARTVHRDKKSGKRRNLAEEAEEEREKQAKQAAKEAKYQHWGKGVKQAELHQQAVDDAIHEMSKPLARYQDDQDLDDLLKQQDREGDPMLAFIKKKKAKSTEKELPVYKGPEPPPNRFNLRPGYRWDGVDRSNGFENKIFAKKSEKKAIKEVAYKWSTEDM